MKESKNNKKTKSNIGRNIAIFVIIVIFYFVSPRVYSVTTALYNQGTKASQKNVENAMGEDNTEERFRLYFQWYNVVHELGHGLLYYNNGVDVDNVDEEQLVNDFAVAYWKYYGEEEKVQELEDIVNYAVEHVGTYYEKGVDYIELGKENSDKNGFYKTFFNFNDYGWFQFSSVKHSFETDKSLEEVLKEMGFENFNLGEKKILEYNEINEEVSTKIMSDAVGNFKSWGLKYARVIHHFDEDPNYNFSRSMVKYLGIFEIPDIIYTIRTTK